MRFRRKSDRRDRRQRSHRYRTFLMYPGSGTTECWSVARVELGNAKAASRHSALNGKRYRPRHMPLPRGDASRPTGPLTACVSNLMVRLGNLRVLLNRKPIEARNQLKRQVTLCRELESASLEEVSVKIWNPAVADRIHCQVQWIWNMNDLWYKISVLDSDCCVHSHCGSTFSAAYRPHI
jgi:hypothetical protein